MISEERWMPIPGYENYSVSDLGRVKNSKKIMKQPLSTPGYHYVTLCKNATKKNYFIHVLVLTVFDKPRPSEDFEACHIDGNCKNNALSNLKWGTAAENYADKLRHGRGIAGENHGCRKLTLSQVNEIRSAYQNRANGLYKAKEFQERFCVSRSAIQKAANGKNWNSPIDQMISRKNHECG